MKSPLSKQTAGESVTRRRLANWPPECGRFELVWKSVLWQGAILLASVLVSAAQTVQFTNFLRLTNQEVALKFIAPAGLTYRIDASTNLAASNDWNGLVTL